MTELAALPFSRPQSVSGLRDRGSAIVIFATPSERAALAAEDGLEGIASLEAEFFAKREGRTGIKITGEVRAKITQTCVLSAEPFESDIKMPVDARFDSGAPAENVDFGIVDMDPPDPIVDGKIDLGALAAEFLALALDPYPRKPAAKFTPEEVGLAPEKISPFADLKAKLAAKANKT